MMRIVLILCIMVGSTLQAEGVHPGEAKYGTRTKDVIQHERTWKMNKKSYGYIFVAVITKVFLLIKLALAKLAILGNISIMLSKLSLILSIVLTLGKYFGGISKMLKLKPVAYDEHQSYHYSGHGDHGSYIT